MANAVFANGREIACKAGSGKTICAMPDVCFTPPENPATPPGVPIPYPNTGMDSDTTDGSKKVKITDKEVGLKNKSCFKKSMGDEAGAAAKKGVITSKNTGKVFFNAWSMDVKIEGQNAVRHLDLTTNNHASLPGDTPPWPFAKSMKVGSGDPCEKEKDNEKKACDGAKKKSRKKLDCSSAAGGEDACIKAKQCKMVPKKDDKKECCSPHNTGHHLIPENCCKGEIPGYKGKKAPTVCAGGHSWHRKCKSPIPNAEKTHPALHEIQDVITRKVIRVAKKLKSLGKLKDRTVKRPWKYKDVKKVALKAHRDVFGDHCSKDCIAAQLDEYHGKEVADQERPLKAKKFGNKINDSDPFLSSRTGY